MQIILRQEGETFRELYVVFSELLLSNIQRIVYPLFGGDVIAGSVIEAGKIPN